MNQSFCPAVPNAVQEFYAEVSAADTLYSAASAAVAKRLVTDPRMETFYRSDALAWARGSNAATAWRLWFSTAFVAADIGEDEAREAVKRQQENVSQLVRLLDEACDLLRDIEQDEGPARISFPLELSDVLHLIDATAKHPGIVDSHDRARYEMYSRPRLDEVFRFNSSAANFLPSVAQLLACLSSEASGLEAQLASRKTIPWRGHSAADHLTSQKSNKYRAYVRSVDRAMWELRHEYIDRDRAECWRLPDSLLALQCKVALGEGDLEGFVDRIRKSRLNLKSEEM